MLFLLALCAFVLVASSPASAGIVAKDGKIHACYKAKGKGKGSLRVVRSAKVKCPKKWKKVSWYASGPAGPQGEAGSPGGGSGETGTNGSNGLPGTPATATVVKGLENKVTELLNKVTSLESVLKGIDNQQLKEAIAGIAKTQALEAAVAPLCSQAEALTKKSGELGTTLSGFGTILDALSALPLPGIPTALPPFSCP